VVRQAGNDDTGKAGHASGCPVDDDVSIKCTVTVISRFKATWSPPVQSVLDPRSLTEHPALTDGASADSSEGEPALRASFHSLLREIQELSDALSL
jgi:hypothetical protein